MFDSLSIRNFKCLRNIDLGLSKLNLLVGPNNSGKSSVLQALAFLAQQTGDFAFDGEFVNLGSFEDIIFEKKSRNAIDIKVSLRLDKREIRRIRNETANSAYDNFNFTSIAVLVSINLDANKRPRSSVSLFSKDGELLGERIPKPDGRYEVRYNQKITTEAINGGNVTTIWPWGFGPGPAGAEFCANVTDVVKSIIRDRILNQVYYFSPFRNVSARTENVTPEPTRVKPNGENTIALLLYTQINREAQFRKIVKWMKEFNIGNLSNTLEGGMSKTKFKDEKLSVIVDAPELGYGSNQLFPVIVQSFSCEPGSIIMIEEPEISLHAGAQAKLPYLFSEIIDEDKQIIITTHSIYTPLALGRAIRDERCNLKRSDVQLYELSKGTEGAARTRLRLDERGNISGWISEVAKIEDELYKDWSNALPKEL